jgi:cell wall assembly regulator SMI1
MLPLLASIGDSWTRIERVLRKHAPATALTLAGPAADEEIDELEAEIGLVLPLDFRQSLKVHNGQDDPTGCHHFFVEGLLASTKQIAETWRMLTELDEDFRRREPDWDTHGNGEWWNRHWVPFTIGDGNCLCINLNSKVRPGSKFGEIVCHIHDNPHEPGIAAGYSAWLEHLAQRLENGEFTINEYGYLDLNISRNAG